MILGTPDAVLGSAFEYVRDSTLWWPKKNIRLT